MRALGAPPRGAPSGAPSSARVERAHGRCASTTAAAAASTSSSSKTLVYCASDLHVDYKENEAWVRGLREREASTSTSSTTSRSTSSSPTRVMCVAGDVSDDITAVERCLKEFQRRHDVVAYTFGNHELWLNKRDAEERGIEDSLAKIDAILSMCASIGVVTSPTLVNDEIWVAPIHSYHHQSWDDEANVAESVPPVEVIMNDFRFSNFRELDASTEDVARYCDALNDAGWDAFLDAVEPEHKIVSMSHFVPRIELIPEKRMLFYPRLPQASGSVFLRARVEQLKARVNPGHIAHVFGHTHFGWSTELDGVRYIQAALATPKEWIKRPRSLQVGNFTNASDEPMCVYDGEAFAADDQRAMWSEYYRAHPRTPNNVELAPHAREFVRRRWGAHRRAMNAKDDPEAPLPGATGKVV